MVADVSPLGSLQQLQKLEISYSVLAGMEAVATGCPRLTQLTVDGVRIQQQQQQEEEAGVRGVWASLQQLSMGDMGAVDMLFLMRIGAGLPAGVRVELGKVNISADLPHRELRAWAEALAAVQLHLGSSEGPSLHFEGRVQPQDPGLLSALRPAAGFVRSLTLPRMRLAQGDIAALCGALPGLTRLDLSSSRPHTASAMEAVVGLPGLRDLELPKPLNAVSGEVYSAYAAACVAAQAARAVLPAMPPLRVLFISEEALEVVRRRWEALGRAAQGPVRVQLQHKGPIPCSRLVQRRL